MYKVYKMKSYDQYKFKTYATIDETCILVSSHKHICFVDYISRINNIQL